MRTWMIVICRKKDLHSIVDELTDWKGEGVELAIYSTTEKTHQGFIFITWNKPISERFITKLKNDSDFLDYFTVDTVSFQTQPLP